MSIFQWLNSQWHRLFPPETRAAMEARIRAEIGRDSRARTFEHYDLEQIERIRDGKPC
jgi:hypothetical protein